MTDLVNKQYFNSPNVHLEIASFKSMETWKQYMVDRDLKTIWDFVLSVMPVNVFNIHNFDMIENRFALHPSNQRIVDHLREKDYFCVVRINLHEPLTGCHISIFKDKLSAEVNSKPNILINHHQDRELILHDYTKPDVIRNVSLLNPFVFYQEYVHFNGLETGNKGKRTLMAKGPDYVITNKDDIIYFRKGVFGSIMLETFATYHRDKTHKLYTEINQLVSNLQHDASFYDTPRAITRRIDEYVKAANFDNKRINEAVRHVPIVYTKADSIIRDVRTHCTRLSLIDSDFNQTFTPYLEPGTNKLTFAFGVVSR